jgi:hypothetical protein
MDKQIAHEIDKARRALELEREIDNARHSLDRALASGRKLGAKAVRRYIRHLMDQRHTG